MEFGIVPNYENGSYYNSYKGKPKVVEMEIKSNLTDNQIKLGLVTATLSLIVMYKILTTKKHKLPPGPKGWPFIGNLYELFTRPYLTELFEEYRKKYGDLFTFYMAGKPVVVLNSLERVRETLVEKQNDFAGRPSVYSLDLFTDGGKSFAFGDFTEIWKVQRKIAFSAIRQFATGHQLENLVHDSFDKMVAILEKEKGPVEPMNIISLLIYNIIFNMTCGKNWELNDPEFKEIIDIIDEVNASFGLGLLADFIPIFQYIRTPADRKLRKESDFIKKFLKEAMDEHRKSFDPDNLRDLCDTLISCEIEAKLESGNEVMKEMDEYHYIHLLSDVVFAGTDTSRYTLMWVLIYMARNPDCQRRLQQEVFEVVGKQQLTMADRSQLHYTNAVLHETMRIKTLAPFSLPHKTTCDTTVGEYNLPKGTQVWPNLDALLHDERHWKDPHKFDVTRFLDADGKFTGIPPSFKPFGTGRRVCIGESLAKSELLLLTAMFFQTFSVAAPEGITVSDECEPYNTFSMPKPFKLVFTKRT